ncbi:hypothetical protein L1049_027160 [Liquidambar formosana]|uniref:Zinc finger PHD-type domain-containing protein n=1 Tax=Liquidambar formosana TaxID=63359 RepID=A0AAP0N7S4_LIQFO
MITPVLKEGCDIQGPADGSNSVIDMTVGSSGIEKRIGRHFSRGILHIGAESGTCNLCATPSSCKHFNQVPSLMGPKSDESSDEAYLGKKTSRCSFDDDADLSSPIKGSSCNERQRTSSETSNLVNPCSSHDSYSENAESKANLNASDNSEDVEMLVKETTGQAVVEDSGSSKPCSFDVGKIFSYQQEKQKASECDVECLQATAVFSNKSDPSEISSLRDVCVGTSSPKGEQSEGSTEQVESSLARGENFSVGLRYDAHDSAESGKPEIEMGDGDPTEETINCQNQTEYFERSSVSLKLQEPPLQSQCANNIEGSDLMEDDVKVCDICGDAGREDLLAICTKCTDGAEHTYCMRIKLDKVPQGDWMCEDCMLTVKYEKQKQDDFEKVVGTSNGSSLVEISQNSRNSSVSKGKSSLKLDIKDSSFKKSATDKSSSNPHFSVKRPADNLVTASVSKRRALERSVGSLEISVGSPKVSSPSGKVLLSRDSSLKNLYEGKLKPGHHKSPPRDHSSTNILENAHKLLVSGHNSPKFQSKGSLFRSNSVKILDSRMKVQQPEQDVIQKQKFAREIVTNDRKKEGTVRVMSKSMSFSGATLGRSNATDSKVKMLSSNSSRVEDLKRLRDEKDQNPIRRKNSFRSEYLIVKSPVAGSGVSASKSDKKVASGGDSTSPLSSQSNGCDRKAVCHQSSNNSSKPFSHLAQEGTKLPNDSGCASADGTNEGQDRVVNDVRQHGDHSMDIEAQNSDASLPSEERPYMRGLPRLSPAVAVSSRITAVPELHYIWRGRFEMQKSGKLPTFCDGIQAHLSTCASPKVLETVNKFSHKILLEEVSRLKTWPTQFLENCATEDHIALYFFAEDLESYGRNYKSLLECMMENDLALRGNVDGIELLIFSSNLLPEKSQRWNKLSFLWGVFRGRRVDYSEQKPNSQKMICIPNLNMVPSEQDLSIPSMSGSQNMFFPGQFGESLSAPIISHNAQQASNSVSQLELPLVSSGGMDQICESRVSSSEERYLGLKTNFDMQPCRVDPISSSSVSKKNEQLSSDMQDDYTSLKERRDPERRQEVDYKPCLKASRECAMDCVMVDQESECKRMKSSFNGISESGKGVNNSGDRFSSGLSGFCPRLPINDQSCYGSHDMEITDDLRRSGRSLFSAHPSPMGDCLGAKFKQILPSGGGNYVMESGVPNLELSLGAENKLAKQGIASLFPGTVDKEQNQGGQPNPVTNSKNNDDDDGELSASLSLSLGLPFSDKDPVSKTVSKPKQLLPERHGMNNLFLFGGFPNALDV